MITEDKVTEIFCMADELCKFFGTMMLKYMLKSYNCGYHGNSTISIPENIFPGSIQVFHWIKTL